MGLQTGFGQLEATYRPVSVSSGRAGPSGLCYAFRHSPLLKVGN